MKNESIIPFRGAWHGAKRPQTPTGGRGCIQPAKVNFNLHRLSIDLNNILSIITAQKMVRYSKNEGQVTRALKVILCASFALEAISWTWKKDDSFTESLTYERLKGLEKLAKDFLEKVDKKHLKNVQMDKYRNPLSFKPEWPSPSIIKYTKQCQPQISDSQEIIFTKLCAAISNLAYYLKNSITADRVVMQGLTIDEVKERCSPFLEIIRELANTEGMSRTIRICIELNIFNTRTGLPFNIKLPE